jgi:hypothetical protein
MKSTPTADRSLSDAVCCALLQEHGRLAGAARRGERRRGGVSARPHGWHGDADCVCARGCRRSAAGLAPITDGGRVQGRTPRSTRQRARLELTQSRGAGDRRRRYGQQRRVVPPAPAAQWRSARCERVGLTARYPRGMANERADRGLELVELHDERVRAALTKIDEMSDSELRELARGEPQLFVEAAEGIIARRHSVQHP